jgi:hypothetical protein
MSLSVNFRSGTSFQGTKWGKAILETQGSFVGDSRPFSCVPRGTPKIRCLGNDFPISLNLPRVHGHISKDSLPPARTRVHSRNPTACAFQPPQIIISLPRRHTNITQPASSLFSKWSYPYPIPRNLTGLKQPNLLCESFAPHQSCHRKQMS